MSEEKKKIAIDDELPMLDVRMIKWIGNGFCLAKWTQVTMHLQLDILIPVIILQLIKFH